MKPEGRGLHVNFEETRNIHDSMNTHFLKKLVKQLRLTGNNLFQTKFCYEGHPIKNETFFIVLKPVCAFSQNSP